ncbi:MAG: DUF4394 domain-containing protein [candidate division KSB1 bacterium]
MKILVGPRPAATWRTRETITSLCCALTLSLCACDAKLPTLPRVQGRIIYGLDGNNNLIRFGSMSPGTVTNTFPISGLQNGENILGIDFRPNDGRLFGMSNMNRVYTLDTLSGVAASVGVAAFTPVLNGFAFGFDFNPVPDRIRVHSDAEQDLRLNPNTGSLAGSDSSLTYAGGDANFGINPNIVGTAYTNSVVGASTTTLYAIDSGLDVLVTLPTPNNGSMYTIGALGVNTSNAVGFDITGNDGVAYAALTVAPNIFSSLYFIDLSSGTAVLLGNIANPSALRGIAVAP